MVSRKFSMGSNFKTQERDQFINQRQPIAMKSTTKTLGITLAALLFCLTTNAQTLTQAVKGRIIDTNTKRPLPGANITVINSDPLLGATTDADGYFRLEKVPVGRHSFAITYLGYEDAFLAEVLVGSAKEVDLPIQLTESLNTLDEVTINASKDNAKANNKMANVSARSFSVAETKRFPASFTDPGRMVLSFAGVTNSDDSSNEIIVRGNAPNQLLWKVEGIEVPEPNHFSEEGFSAGNIGMISTNLLGKSDFFTGAFPAEYGNALSGVFDIKLRNGNADKNEYAFQLGVLGIDFAVEGPFSKKSKSSYLVNYRYSTLALLDDLVDFGDSSVPTYQDLSFKIHLPLSNKTQLSLWGIGGISESDDMLEMINDSLSQDEFFDSKTYMGGLNFQHFLSDKSTLKAIISLSGNQSNFESVEMDSENNSNEIVRDLLKNSAVRATLDFSHKLNAKTTLQTGAIFSLLHYDLVQDMAINGVKEFELNEENNANMTQMFIQGKHRFNPKLSSTFGVHSTYFSINNDFVIEPRGGLTYKINPKHTLSLGFGVHSRRMSLNQYFVDEVYDDVFLNRDLDLMRAHHYIVGYDWRIIKNGHLKIEAYYQDINKVAIAKNPENTAAVVNGNLLSLDLTDDGKARNYGLELTFEKFFSDQYYFLLTASLFDNKYKAADDNWYNSRFNSNYTFNIVGGKEFSVRNNNILGVNTKTLWNGNERSTPFNINEFTNTGSLSLLQKQRNTISLDDYFRIDISGYYRINRPKVSHVLSLDIQNITNRQNIDNLFFNSNLGTSQPSYQLGLTPIFNYRIEF